MFIWYFWIYWFDISYHCVGVPGAKGAAGVPG
jgi:hypothetical protein